MTATFTPSTGAPTPPAAPRRATWRERAFVLGGLGLAALCTAATLASGADTAHVGPLWMAAIAWTVVASLAAALRRGFRHRDWSAFGRHEFPENDGDIDEWASRTGRYSWLGDMEDRLLHDDDHLR